VKRALDRLGERDLDALERSGMPEWLSPMLATLTDDRFSSDDWIYERKLDGERCLVFRDGRSTRLFSRNRKRIDDSYPELAEALASQPADRFVVDGEIVAFEGAVTSFARLQDRIGLHDPEQARASGVKVYLYLFDLLYLDEYLTTALPLRSRKVLLRGALSFKGPLRYTSHRNRDGQAYHQEACRKGWEGVIAKRADSPYVHSRSRNWLKFKCVASQELVIVGFTDPRGGRVGFGALLLGFYGDGELRYAGKVGTGFDRQALETLGAELREIERGESPVAGDPPEASHAHWVEPKLVAQIGFTEWTADDRLRHPRFLGLRRDKAPGDVHKETPERS
jgi:DNA ligase D-like protein (predicted ligase)